MPDYDSPAKQPEPRNYIPALEAILKLRGDLEGGENTATLIARSIAGDARFLPESELKAYADHAVATRPHLAAFVKPPTQTPMEAAVMAHRASMNPLGVGLDRGGAIPILPEPPGYQPQPAVVTGQHIPAGLRELPITPTLAKHEEKTAEQLKLELVGHMQGREGAFNSSIAGKMPR